MKFPHVFSLALIVRLSSCDEVILDLSSSDPSLARDYKSTVDGVVYHSFFSTGLFFSKVVDGGVTLWEAEGEERCDVLFTSVGNRTRVILHVWVKGLPSKTLHYEKLDGEWKLVTIRVKGVPESEEPVSPQEFPVELDFANLGCPLGGFSGSEARPKVTLPPTESNNNGEDASENKVEGGAPDDEEESGESQPKEVDKEEPDQQSNEYAAELVTDVSLESTSDKYESSPSTAAEPSPTEDTEQISNSVPEGSKEPVDKQTTEVSELQESEPLQSTESSQEVAYQQSEAPLEDPKPVSNEEEPTTEPKVSTSEKSNEVEDSGETLVEEVQPEVAPAESPEDDEPGNGSEKEFGDSESTGYESSDNNLPETKVEEPEEPTKPANSSLSKVDSTLFNVEEGEDNGFKVLKLTVKNGSTVKELKYDGKEIWSSGIFGSPCSSAVIYMNGDRPTLAVLVTRDKNNKQSKVYRYHDGKQWKNGREGTHKTRLKELQDAARPKESTETVGDNVEEKARPANKPGDVPARRDPVKTVQHTPQAPSTNKPDTEDSPVVQQNLYTPTQQAVKPVTASSVQVDSTPIALDLTKIDESKILVHTETKSEVTVKYHYPKDTSLDTSKITTVVDGEKEVWKGVDKEHALSVLVYYAKGDSSLITIGISKGSGSKLDFKHFEKVGGEWVSIDKEDYDKKLKDLKSGVTNPSTTLPS